MKDIRLLSLKLKNFKGIESFTLDPDGKDVSIFGDNRTGKSTVADSVAWVLFDKDSLNQAKFEIKTLDKNGEPLHGLDHEVEATFQVGDGTFTLRKVYKEQWVKRRGAAQKEFTGHATEYFIDGVPVNKTEYCAFIKAMCPEDLFRLLTNPRHFNDHLHWQERRKLLLEVCGDVTTEDVIASDKDLKALPDVLDGKTIEDRRKMLKASQTKINDELKSIPVRIDEVTASKIDAPRDPETVKSVIEVCKGRRQELVEKLNQIENGGEVVTLQKQVAEIDTKIIDIQNKEAAAHRKAQDEHDKGRRALVAAVHKTDDEFNAVVREQALVSTDIDAAIKAIEALEATMEALRKQWHEVNDTNIEHVQESVCPTCGQSIPEESLEKARQDAQEHHNAAKAQMLSEISAKGKTTKEQRDDKRDEVKALQGRLTEIDNSLPVLAKAKDDASVAVIAHDSFTLEAKPNPAIADMTKTKSALLLKISKAKEGSTGSADEVRAEVAKVDADIEKHQAEILAIEANKRISARVDELKKRERELAAVYEKNEAALFLFEKFERRQAEMLESSINSRFKMVKFKLFNTAINGGIEPTCITTVNGVPYPSANNEARINGGISICNVLAEFYGMVPLQIIDNAESVTNLLPSIGQQIKLVVSEPDKSLRVA